MDYYITLKWVIILIALVSLLTELIFLRLAVNKIKIKLAILEGKLEVVELVKPVMVKINSWEQTQDGT